MTDRLMEMHGLTKPLLANGGPVSKSESESPLLNGFAGSEDGDEERVEEAEGQEEADEEDRDFLENGEPERNGAAATAAEEEEEADSGDMTDGDLRGTYDSADAEVEETAAAAGTGGDCGRSSATVSRCLAEDFEAAAASDNPQCSPQHRASLRSPTAATASATASKRVCNTKRYLTSLPAKQAPDASEAAETASGRGSANPKTNALGGSEKSCAFADLFNSALDSVAGEHPSQPTGGCCEGLDELASTVPPDDDDLSGCLLNLAAAAASAAATAAATERTGSGVDLSALAPSSSNSDVTLALLQRQRELRLVCAANHSVLHRLIQAARRDLQRQEIQRRLAIADADVIEAYNKLESYRVLHRPALKRDRDAAWKTLKERQKIRAELEAFDRKGP
ncbi:transcriptional adaptor 3 [Sparganum proliferum]